MDIKDYPKQIARLLLGLHSTIGQLREIRDRIKAAEMDVLVSVLEAKDNSGKLLHTNDRARDIAVYYATQSDASLILDRDRKQMLEQQRATLEAEIERLRGEYRISLIDYERDQLGRRDVA